MSFPMIRPREFYQPHELEYMLNQQVDVMHETNDTAYPTWKMIKFNVHGVIHEQWVYGTSDSTTTGRPFFIFYTHITNAPEYERMRNTDLFKLILGT